MDGRADDGFIAYLNDQEVARWTCGCSDGTGSGCIDTSQAMWPRCQKTVTLNLSQQRNILKLSSYNVNSYTFTEVWNAKATITAESK